MMGIARRVRFLLPLAFLWTLSLRAGETAPPAGGEEARWFATAADLARHYRTREAAGHLLLAHPETALPLLTHALDADAAAARQTAAILLGELVRPEAEKALLGAAVRGDPLVARLARSSLVRLYRKLPASARQAVLGGEDLAGERLAAAVAPRAREAVLRAEAAAAESGGSDLDGAAEARARALLSHKDAGLRAAAADALAFAREEASAKAVVARLGAEEDRDVRLALCRAVARLRPAMETPVLLQWVRGEDGTLAVEAAAALHGIGYGGAVEALEILLKNESASVRRLATVRLGETGSAAALPGLTGACADGAWIVRLAAVNALAARGEGAATPLLRKRMQDADPRVRTAAAMGLHRLGTAGAAQALLEDLRGGELSYRRQAARALGELRERRAVPALCALVNHSDTDLAWQAACALGRIGDVAARPALERARGDERLAIRVAAAEALAALPAE